MSVQAPVEHVHDGDSRPRRTRQRLAVTVSAVVAAGALVGGLLLANHSPAATRQTASAALLAATPPPATATASTRSVIPQPPGPKSRATAATIDYRLQQILPAGRTSGFAHATDDPVFAQINLDQGHGPSMLRMSLTPGGSPGSNWCKPKKADGLTDDCVTLPNGWGVERQGEPAVRARADRGTGDQGRGRPELGSGDGLRAGGGRPAEVPPPGDILLTGPDVVLDVTGTTPVTPSLAVTRPPPERVW
jgi:hypothetical protein